MGIRHLRGVDFQLKASLAFKARSEDVLQQRLLRHPVVARSKFVPMDASYMKCCDLFQRFACMLG